MHNHQGDPFSACFFSKPHVPVFVSENWFFGAFGATSFRWDLQIWIDRLTVTRLDKQREIHDQPLKVDPKWLVPLFPTFLAPKVLRIEEIFFHATSWRFPKQTTQSRKEHVELIPKKNKRSMMPKNDALNRKNTHNPQWGINMGTHRTLQKRQITSATNHVTK